MTQALAAADPKIKPRRRAIAWHKPEDAGSQAQYPEFDPVPGPWDPVVLHLFGTEEDPASMVLTQDNYLDYLARISRDHERLLPPSVQDALAKTTLLFLGYRLQDLGLKVILRGLLPALDQARWKRYHVAVQIDQETRDPSDEVEVRRYLQQYFGGSRIDVYWGSAHQFMTDLHARWQEYME